MTSSPRSRAWVASVATMSSASNPALSTIVMPSVDEDLADQAHLLAEDVGGLGPAGLVVDDPLVAERGLGPVEGHDHPVGRVVAQHVDQHRREPVHRVGHLARRRGQVGGQGEEGAVGERVPVDQQKSLAAGPGHGRLRPRSSGLAGAVDDLLGDVAGLDPVVHRRLLDPVEGLVLAHAVAVHEDALGPVDQLAGLELLLERLGLVLERAHLAVASEGDLHGGDELGALERLDQVGQGAGVAGLFDEVALGVGGEDQHGRLLVVGDLSGHLETVEAGHPDVEDGQVGFERPSPARRPRRRGRSRPRRRSPPPAASP